MRISHFVSLLNFKQDILENKNHKSWSRLVLWTFSTQNSTDFFLWTAAIPLQSIKLEKPFVFDSLLGFELDGIPIAWRIIKPIFSTGLKKFDLATHCLFSPVEMFRLEPKRFADSFFIWTEFNLNPDVWDWKWKVKTCCFLWVLFSFSPNP